MKAATCSSEVCWVTPLSGAFQDGLDPCPLIAANTVSAFYWRSGVESHNGAETRLIEASGMGIA